MFRALGGIAHHLWGMHPNSASRVSVGGRKFPRPVATLRGVTGEVGRAMERGWGLRTTKVAELYATIFSWTWHPPPPLMQSSSGVTSSAPSIQRSIFGDVDRSPSTSLFSRISCRACTYTPIGTGNPWNLSRCARHPSFMVDQEERRIHPPMSGKSRPV
jgi:hypothetical protein